MGAQSRVANFLLSLALFPSATRGIRISSITDLDSNARNISEFLPPDRTYAKGTKYACIQKWQSGGMWQSKFVNQFCLADHDLALKSIAKESLRFATNMESCQSTKEQHAMKVCALKGESPDARLSYSTKTHVPKSCFLLEEGGRYPVLEADKDLSRCQAMLALPESAQGRFSRRETTTTTTTATTILEGRETEDLETLYADGDLLICDCKDGFIGKMVGKACECEPAPCDITGTIGDGPSCHCVPGLAGEITWFGATPSGECIAEAKLLFTEGDEKLWALNGMAIKCCVSSAGKPTKLQDLHAGVLPADGAFGRYKNTGCGYMFGDTYHNGLKTKHGKGPPTCPVPVMKIMDEIAASFDEVRQLLNLPESENKLN